MGPLLKILQMAFLSLGRVWKGSPSSLHMAFDPCMVWPWSCSAQFKPSPPLSFTVLQPHLLCVLAHSRCGVPSTWNALSLVAHPSGQARVKCQPLREAFSGISNSGASDLHSTHRHITGDTSTSWFLHGHSSPIHLTLTSGGSGTYAEWSASDGVCT